MENKIPYQVIKQITNNYDKARILGSGGFGTVYKGVITRDVQHVVLANQATIAVKVFDGTSIDDREFRKEFDNLKALKHKNIVRLVGFCNDIEEVVYIDNGKQVPAEKLHTALCLEYVQNGDLGSYITDESLGFNWHIRYKIIKGVCEGLKYLHEEIDPPILHLDLKPQNILLDKGMTPKIADFGLSRFFGEEKTRKTANPCGTMGYVPPEYNDFQVISDKFDIYSLGVIMIKIIAGRERFFRIGDMSRKGFVNQVHGNWKKQLHKILPSRSLEVHCQQVRRCTELALDCVKKNRQERPTIQQIVSDLIETETMIGNLGFNMEQFPHGESIVPEIDIAENPSPENDPNTITSEPRQESNQTAMNAPAKELTFNFLAKITNEFSDDRKLGEHSFGAAYKGTLEDGKMITVVKFEPDSAIGRDRTFTDRIQSFSPFNHENIVKILGYCREARRKFIEIDGRSVVVDTIETLLCYEYFASRSLADYIDGQTCQLGWDMKFKMIVGICQGLHFMHTLPLPFIHTDLKPENIFLDNNLEPKLCDFGQSRQFGQEVTQINTRGRVESIGYKAPNYLYNGEISHGTDIYSLGIIILEITTGQRNPCSYDPKRTRRFIEEVKEKWTLERIMGDYPEFEEDDWSGGWDAIESCIKIGLQCVQIDSRKRPTTEHILDMLDIKPKGPYVPQEGQYYVIQEDVVKHELLEVHPRELCFPFERKKHVSCSLQLRNKGEDHVAFMFVSRTPDRYLTKLPLCGILPHRCTYTHTITMDKQEKQEPYDGGEFFKLHAVAVGKFDLQDLEKDSIVQKYEKFFTEAKEVQEVTLNVNCDPPLHKEQTQSTIQIKITKDSQQVSSIDVHLTEPWLMTASDGSIHVWNYKTMKKLSLFEEEHVIQEKVHVAKFLEREKWIVAGDTNGRIHVYNYDEHDEVKFFRAHKTCITSMALHPTRPILLSSSSDDDNLIKLWDWEKNWKDKTFPGHADKVMQVRFNSDNPGSFTTASLDGTIKIWNIDYDDGEIVTLGEEGYVGLRCVDNFERYNRQHLIAGSMNGTAQIWNMEIKGEGCVQSLEGHGECISTVTLHPEQPMLITGSFDGTVRLWNSDTYKLNEIINFNLGQVYAFGFIKAPRRIVVGCHQGIAMMEISAC